MASLAGLGAYLARRGRFRGRWRRYGWRLVLYLGRVPCRAFAARLRALWRGGWCWSVLAPCVALGGPCVAGAGAGVTGGAWPLPPLRCGSLQWPPLRSLVLQSSAPAAVGPFAGLVGGVALVAWSDCQRAGAAGVAGAVAVFVVAVAGVEPAPPLAVSSLRGLGPCGPWWLVFAGGVVLLQGDKARGGGLGQFVKGGGVHWRALGGYLAPALNSLI